MSLTSTIRALNNQRNASDYVSKSLSVPSAHCVYTHSNGNRQPVANTTRYTKVVKLYTDSPCCERPHCGHCPHFRCGLRGWGRWPCGEWRPWFGHRRSRGASLEGTRTDSDESRVKRTTPGLPWYITFNGFPSLSAVCVCSYKKKSKCETKEVQLSTVVEIRFLLTIHILG